MSAPISDSSSVGTAPGLDSKHTPAAEKMRYPSWLALAKNQPGMSMVDSALTDIQLEIANLRVVGMRAVLDGKHTSESLRDDYERMLALAMYSGEDMRFLMEIGKEIARLQGWYAGKSRTSKVSSDPLSEKKFIEELTKRKKEAV